MYGVGQEGRDEGRVGRDWGGDRCGLVVYGCFWGMGRLGYGRFGGFHPVVTELSKQCT